MSSRSIALIAGAALGLVTSAAAQPVSLSAATMPRIGAVDARDQSYNVEALEVIGGKFWKPTGRNLTPSSRIRCRHPELPRAIRPSEWIRVYTSIGYRQPIDLDAFRAEAVQAISSQTGPNCGASAVRRMSYRRRDSGATYLSAGDRTQTPAHDRSSHPGDRPMSKRELLTLESSTPTSVYRPDEIGLMIPGYKPAPTPVAYRSPLLGVYFDDEDGIAALGPGVRGAFPPAKSRPQRRRSGSPLAAGRPASCRTERTAPTASRRLLPAPFLTAILAVMKSVTALEAKNRFGEVLEAAQRQPVSITRNGRPSVVMISAESYARRQRMARERLRQAMQRAGEHATAQGMNDDELDRLLADES